MHNVVYYKQIKCAPTHPDLLSPCFPNHAKLLPFQRRHCA